VTGNCYVLHLMGNSEWDLSPLIDLNLVAYMFCVPDKGHFHFKQ